MVWRYQRCRRRLSRLLHCRWGCHQDGCFRRSGIVGTVWRLWRAAPVWTDEGFCRVEIAAVDELADWVHWRREFCYERIVSYLDDFQVVKFAAGGCVIGAHDSGWA